MFNDDMHENDTRTASEKAGLPPIIDNGHIIITCSNCNQALVDVWQTHSDVGIVSTIVVQCAYCGDKSFEKEIAGIFHLGHADGVYIADTQTLDNNKYMIITKK